MYSAKQSSKARVFKTLGMLLAVASFFGANTATFARSAAAAPITLQIIDVAGEAQLVQGMIDNYVKANPDKISGYEIVKDTAPNLPGRIKAQIDGGKIDTALVLG